MVQHVVSMKSQNNIDKLNNFMKLCIMVEVFLIVFNDLNWIVLPILIKYDSILNLIILSILIVLIRLLSNCAINDQILSNNNVRHTSKKHDDQEFVEQVDESMTIDNTPQIIGARFGNSRKQLIISFFIATHSAHNNNLNDNYLHFRSDPFANYYVNTSMCSELVFAAEIDTIGDCNVIIAMCDQLLTDTMKAEVILSNLSIICETRNNAVIMREYNAEKVYLYNTALILANFYYPNKIKDGFEAITTVTSLAERSITLCLEAKVECLEYADVVFDVMFGNTTQRVAENETKSGHHDGFDTIMIWLCGHRDVFLVLKHCIDISFC